MHKRGGHVEVLVKDGQTGRDVRTKMKLTLKKETDVDLINSGSFLDNALGPNFGISRQNPNAKLD